MFTAISICNSIPFTVVSDPGECADLHVNTCMECVEFGIAELNIDEVLFYT